jgi:shikimate kinase
MMGSGKTTIGRQLARRTGRPFLDNDALVRELTRREPQAIDAEEGEDALHAAEIAVVHAALTRPGSAVVAVAGDVVDDPAAREELRIGADHVVWLRARPQTLRDRIGGGTGRPGLAQTERESGSGGRTRTYDQAVNSRPLYH